MQVDGLPQLTPPVVTKPYAAPAANRWHAGTTFDFAEGWFKGGYGEPEGPAVQVEHNRQVAFLRRVPMWIVIDRMHGDGKPHRYTNVWNFQPEMRCPKDEELHFDMEPQVAGFAENEVLCDPAAKTIRTCDPDAPNVELSLFCQGTVEMRKFHGQLNPVRGWLAPAIPGRRYPKVDTHSTWQGAAAVTAIVPSRSPASPVKAKKDLCQGEVVGFAMEFLDGSGVACLCAPAASLLEHGGVKVECQALLIYAAPDGKTSGMVLDDPRGDSYAFDLAPGGALRRTDEIRIPGGFAWERGPDGGERPIYQ